MNATVSLTPPQSSFAPSGIPLCFAVIFPARLLLPRALLSWISLSRQGCARHNRHMRTTSLCLALAPSSTL